jgi:hypothetical protein
MRDLTGIRRVPRTEGLLEGPGVDSGFLPGIGEALFRVYLTPTATAQ